MNNKTTSEVRTKKKARTSQKIDWRSPKRLPYYGEKQMVNKEESW